MNPFLDSLGHSGLKNKGLPPGGGSGCFQSSQDAVNSQELEDMESILDKHIQSAHELKKCSLCDASFKKNSLKKHMSTVHEEKKREGNRPMCNICEKSFSNKFVLQKHKEEVHEKKIIGRCPTCDKGFSYRASLRIHIESVRNGVIYKCDRFCYSITFYMHS